MGGGGGVLGQCLYKTKTLCKILLLKISLLPQSILNIKASLNVYYTIMSTPPDLFSLNRQHQSDNEIVGFRTITSSIISVRVTIPVHIETIQN